MHAGHVDIPVNKTSNIKLDISCQYLRRDTPPNINQSELFKLEVCCVTCMVHVYAWVSRLCRIPYYTICTVHKEYVQAQIAEEIKCNLLYSWVIWQYTSQNVYSLTEDEWSLFKTIQLSPKHNTLVWYSNAKALPVYQQNMKCLNLQHFQNYVLYCHVGQFQWRLLQIQMYVTDTVYHKMGKMFW